jgi:hypothetical protein
MNLKGYAASDKGFGTGTVQVGRCDWVTASGEVTYSSHDGNGMERVHYWMRIYIGFIEVPHVCEVCCKNVNPYSYYVWEGSVTAPSLYHH